MREENGSIILATTFLVATPLLIQAGLLLLGACMIHYLYETF